MRLVLLFITLLFCCSSIPNFGQSELPNINSRPLEIGETISFESKILNETRELNIYLPSSYNPGSAITYPVIYLLDGSKDEDFIHIAGVTQFGSFPWINMLPETIVVGISNVDRKRDFTFPTSNKQDKQDFPTAGGSTAFVGFIKKEVQPLVNQRFKTNDDATIIGQSLGGLLATEILFTQPDLFDNYVIVSPSLWWDDESLLKMTPKENTLVNAVSIAVGNEGEVMERTAKELYEKLNSLSNNNFQLNFKNYPDLDHGDALHLVVYDAFWMIFGGKE